MPVWNKIESYFRVRRQSAIPGGGILFLASWLVSVFFHPLLMPTYIAALLFGFDLLVLNPEARAAILVFLFSTTFLLPILAIGLLWAAGLLKSLSMEDKKDRLLPHLITLLVYIALAWFFFHYLPMIALLGYLMAGIAVSVGITALITIFWKISSHMAGVGGLLGFQLAIISGSNNSELLMPIIVSMLICGAVAASRFYLRAHNWLQLAAGFLLGMVISSATVRFFV
jgi:hypothetical protein